MGIYAKQWAVSKLETVTKPNGMQKADIVDILCKDEPLTRNDAQGFVDHLTINKTDPNVTYTVFNLAA